MPTSLAACSRLSCSALGSGGGSGEFTGTATFACVLVATAGDLFEDPLPEGHDALILAHVVHYFDPARNLELLRGIRERVSAGARLLIVDFWTNPQHTEPLFAVLMAGEFLTNVGGDVFSEEEGKGWLRESGWEYVQTIPLEGPNSLIVGEAI
jgi:O-methyltransferase domain